MEKIDWEKISKNQEVIDLLKQRDQLEKKIRNLDEEALIKYDLERLSLEDYYGHK